jgi:hypothetical protein
MANGFAAREASSGAVGTTGAILFEWKRIFPFSSLLAFLFLFEEISRYSHPGQRTAGGFRLFLV